MWNLTKTMGILILLLVTSLSVRAAGLDASLDRYDTSIPMQPPTVLNATLHNGGASRLYVTGVRVMLSNNAAGDVYNPALLYQEVRQLDPGQTWDGPLIQVTPMHRGSLDITGRVVLKGGTSPEASGTLATIALQLTVLDPKREADGTFERGTRPACDRSLEACCVPTELECEQTASRCIYVADGFDREQVCVNQQAGPVYDHISDLRISSDAAHWAYLGSLHCSQTAVDELCERRLVLDAVEQKRPDVPTQLILSPDGRHYAYIGRQTCIIHLGEDICTGDAHVVVDGRAGPKREAVQGLCFSPDSLHVAYEMGKECRFSSTASQPSQLVCRETSPVVDEKPAAAFPAWYASSQERPGFIK